MLRKQLPENPDLEFAGFIHPHDKARLPMVREQRLLDKARNNPGSLRFGEFETLLSQCGWTFRRQKGSHRYWYSPQGHRLSIQPKGAKAKGYQVRQFLKRYDEETNDD